eukprot:TCONS_00029046-protein
MGSFQKKRGNGKIQCPEDRKSIELFEDLGKEREILDSTVKCKNEKHKCQWTGSLRQLDTHLKKCDFEMKKCTNANCTKLIIRKNVSKHALYQCDRSIRCQSCSLLYYRADPLLVNFHHYFFCCSIAKTEEGREIYF